MTKKAVKKKNVTTVKATGRYLLYTYEGAGPFLLSSFNPDDRSNVTVNFKGIKLTDDQLSELEKDKKVTTDKEEKNYIVPWYNILYMELVV